MQERDFKVEIEAARNDAAQLRKIADAIQATGGSRLLVIRAIQLARAVNRRPNGTHYRRAKGDHLAALRWG